VDEGGWISMGYTVYTDDAKAAVVIIHSPLVHDLFLVQLRRMPAPQQRHTTGGNEVSIHTEDTRTDEGEQITHERHWDEHVPAVSFGH
jgi:hypothetical protein